MFSDHPTTMPAFHIADLWHSTVTYISHPGVAIAVGIILLLIAFMARIAHLDAQAEAERERRQMVRAANLRCMQEARMQAQQRKVAR